MKYIYRNIPLIRSYGFLCCLHSTMPECRFSAFTFFTTQEKTSYPGTFLHMTSLHCLHIYHYWNLNVNWYKMKEFATVLQWETTFANRSCLPGFKIFQKKKKEKKKRELGWGVGLLWKERIFSYRGQILSFKSSHQYSEQIFFVKSYFPWRCTPSLYDKRKNNWK